MASSIAVHGGFLCFRYDVLQSIMVFMMSGGIWLRSSGLAPDVFIAVFYTGLGCALALAGILFWIACARHSKN